MRYFLCSHCGNIAELVRDGGVPMYCCSEKMRALDEDGMVGPAEKHLPRVTVEDGVLRVSVAETAHPMSEEHYIGWVALTTDKGVQRKYLEVGNEPKVEFVITGDKARAVYAYCNLHGLWKTEI